MKWFAGWLFVIFLFQIPLHGEVVPGRWEKLELLRRGQDILIHAKSGFRLEGKFQSVGAAEIRFIAESNDRIFPKSAILLIEKIGDPVCDGILKGAAIGAGIGLPLLIWGITYEGGEQDDARTLGIGTFFLSMGIGVAFGTAYDAANSSHEVIYRAP